MLNVKLIEDGGGDVLDRCQAALAQHGRVSARLPKSTFVNTRAECAKAAGVAAKKGVKQAKEKLQVRASTRTAYPEEMGALIHGQD